MKKLLIALLLVSSLSCSKDDNCDEKRNDINENYDNQIQFVMDNPGPNGIDTGQISLLNQERDLKLQQACD